MGVVGVGAEPEVGVSVEAGVGVGVAIGVRTGDRSRRAIPLRGASASGWRR